MAGIIDALKNALAQQSEAYKELQNALKQDKESNIEAENKGLAVDKTYYFKEWFKIYWVQVVIFFIFIFGVWKVLQPVKKKPYIDRRRSHHGINKYGERY